MKWPFVSRKKHEALRAEIRVLMRQAEACRKAMLDVERAAKKYIADVNANAEGLEKCRLALIVAIRRAGPVVMPNEELAEAGKGFLVQWEERSDHIKFDVIDTVKEEMRS